MNNHLGHGSISRAARSNDSSKSRKSTMQRNLFRLATFWLFVGMLWLSGTGSSIAASESRQWRDESGRFSITARLVTADDRWVVLDKSTEADRELVILRTEQLSPADRRYLANRVEGVGHPEPSDTTESAETRQQVDRHRGAAAVQSEDSPDSRWHLRDGDTITGKLIGFGSQRFRIGRQLGDVLVNGEELRSLPAAYRKVLPAVVAEVDDADIGDVEELESHLADLGGGPFDYAVDGVELQVSGRYSLTIPLPLLEPDEARQVADGFRRWQAAQEPTVSEDDRAETNSRERLLLDSYQRLRGRQRPADFGRAATRLKQLELQLLAADAGITDFWEVTLQPPNSYAYPYTVIVPAETSAAARARAQSSFPNRGIVGIAKASD